MRVHEDWSACRAALAGIARVRVQHARRPALRRCRAYAPGDAFVFGPETRGLPEDVLAGFAPEQRLRLPMRPGNRSLNLSNAVAVVVYEAWRQVGFAGGA